MYQPAHFREDRLRVQHDLLRRHPLGLLIASGPGGLVGELDPLAATMADLVAERGNFNGAGGTS
jgi:transcriptional regulator